MKRQDRFTGFVHWLNVFLKPPGRHNRPKLAIRINENCQPCRRRLIENVADVAAVAHVVAHGSDANNIISRAYAAASIITQGDVETAGRVGTKRVKAVGCVIAARCVVTKRPNAVAVFLDPLKLS